MTSNDILHGFLVHVYSWEADSSPFLSTIKCHPAGTPIEEFLVLSITRLDRRAVPSYHRRAIYHSKTRERITLKVMESILWRGIVFPGHEACRLISVESGWQLEGVAVFSHEAQICRLDYQVLCNSVWQTVSAKVGGWLGKRNIDIQIKTDTNGRWWLNDVEQPNVMGCTDLDLNFSPSTNLLPIRRLGLRVGQAAEVKAAWLRFPGFNIAPLSQIYHRLDETTYRYESAGGQFVAELQVNRAGFVVDYPGIWQAESFSE